MHNRLSIGVRAALLMVLAPLPVLAQGNPEDAGVKKLIADFTASLDKADGAAYSAVHVPNAYVIDMGHTLIGNAALMAQFKTDMAAGFKGVKFVSHKVENLRYLSPMLALGTTTWEITIPGQPNMKGTAFFVASKKGGKWVFEGWQAAPNPPAQ